MNIKNKLEELVKRTLKNIRNDPQILQKIKFYEQVHHSLVNNLIKNKREIFYNSVQIFKTQSIVNNLIKKTCLDLKVSQSDLLISTTLKGIFNGSIKFYKNERLVYKNLQGTSLIPDMNLIDKVECKYTKCIIIEKDTIFSKIVRIYTKNDILFICGKGYPCKNTLALVNQLKYVKLFGLFDFDPYGLEICSKYPPLKRIGICIEDLVSIDKLSYIKLSEYDYKKIDSLSKKITKEDNEKKIIKYFQYDTFNNQMSNFINKPTYESNIEDLEYMKKYNLKIELEGLFNSIGFELEKYLIAKTNRKG